MSSPLSTPPARVLELPTAIETGHDTFSTDTIPGVPEKFRYGLSPLWSRSPGPLPSSTLPPVLEPIGKNYFMDIHRIPTPYPPSTPTKPTLTKVGGKFVELTPPPSHTKIEEVPGKLQLNLNKLYRFQGKTPPKTENRTTEISPVNLLQKRKMKPRVYEYEPGSAGKYVDSIKDDKLRQAAMKAFVRATYPPRDDFIPPKDENTYDETLGPNQHTGLRQPMIGDLGIPDTKALLLVLAFRAAYNKYDVNTAVDPTLVKPSISAKKRTYDEYTSDDYDADDDDEGSTTDQERESSPSPSPLLQTTVKKIRLIKKTQPVAPSTITPADSNDDAASIASTIVIEKPSVPSKKRDHDEYASDDGNGGDATVHDSHAAADASDEENKENAPVTSPLPQTTVKKIRLSKKTAAPVDVEAPVQAASSSTITTTTTESNSADAPTVDNAGASTVAATTSAAAASGSQENAAMDHAPAAAAAAAAAPAPKRKYTRKAAPAKVTEAGKQKRGRKSAATATKATPRKANGAGRKKKAAKKDDADDADELDGYGPMGIVTRSMRAKRG